MEFNINVPDNFDLVDVFSDFVSLGEERQKVLLEVLHGLRCAQDELDIADRDVFKYEKSTPGERKTHALDNSPTPIEIRVNNRRFVCDCGGREFIVSKDRSEVVCTVCNSAYNL